MVKAPHPKGLFHGSLESPSLAAAIINGKYVNAVPLYRLEQEFSRYGLAIPCQNMVNWCIRLEEEYLSVFYNYLHKELYFYHVIQADEPQVLVNCGGRKAGSKSYMWVYRSGYLYKNQIILYEYQLTQNELRGPVKGCHRRISKIVQEAKKEEELQEIQVEVKGRANKLLYLIWRYPGGVSVLIGRCAVGIFDKLL